MSRIVRQCHLCPHNGKRRKACLSCREPQLSHKGQIFISIHSMENVLPSNARFTYSDPALLRPGQHAVVIEGVDRRRYYDDPDTVQPGLDGMPIQHASAIIKQWAIAKGLTPRQTQVVLEWIKPGSTKSSVARQCGIGVARVFQILKAVAGDDKQLLRAFRIRERS